MNKELYEKFHAEVGPHNDGVLGYIVWLENRVLGYDAQLWQDLLRDAMRSLSEEYYCAGWLNDLEYYLWEILADDVSENNKDALMGSFDPKDLSKLQRLAGLAGGWFRWVDNADDPARSGEQFILTHEWTPLYLAWKEKRNAEV